MVGSHGSVGPIRRHRSATPTARPGSLPLNLVGSPSNAGLFGKPGNNFHPYLSGSARIRRESQTSALGIESTLAMSEDMDPALSIAQRPGSSLAVEAISYLEQEHYASDIDGPGIEIDPTMQAGSMDNPYLLDMSALEQQNAYSLAQSSVEDVSHLESSVHEGVIDPSLEMMHAPIGKPEQIQV